MLDNIPNGAGAFASIVGGGVGQNATNITLVSQPGGKINSKITILGYKNPPTQPSYQQIRSTQQQQQQPQPKYQQTAFGWKQLPNLPSPPISNLYPNLNSNAYPPSNQHPQYPSQKPQYPWPNFHRKK